MEREGLCDGEAGGPEVLAEGLEEHGDVEVDAPLAVAGRVLVVGGDGILEVEEPGELAVLHLDGLGEVDAVGPLAEFRDGGRG